MSFVRQDYATITTQNVLDLFPPREGQHKRIQLYYIMALLTQGLSDLDVQRGLRSSGTAHGFKVLEPLYRGIPQEAIDKNVLGQIDGLPISFFKDVIQGSAKESIFFDVQKIEPEFKDKPMLLHEALAVSEKISVELSDIGKVALTALEQEFSNNAAYGSIEAMINATYEHYNQLLRDNGFPEIEYGSVNANMKGGSPIEPVDQTLD